MSESGGEFHNEDLVRTATALNFYVCSETWVRSTCLIRPCYLTWSHSTRN